ncbi:MAG: hypothetical protein A2603_10130 [Bdellovibrionales bacterium RIFOXYD1_FULL_55_31]|nr:MAG: hypothetical protein A2603_10130 [Bdellovibrionales bacterium RIFOXYD1_FULL_55_31]
MNTFPRIKILNAAVAERIAAGEVIERPASVVKELVENSLDAGASEIAVFLEDGGKGLIEVLDNGHGMTREDLSLCIERHATSKLSSLADLENLTTLGFRGEALPSIAAVSDLSILSRSSGEGDSGTAYELLPRPIGEAQHSLRPVTFGHFLNSPQGTRIRVQSLFSQVPARLKFLKSQASEVSQVREWVERLAIAHPGSGFRLTSDGRTILNLRPAEEPARTRGILADDESFPVVSADSELPGLRARAHWIQGLSSQQTRRIVQVVNGRAVRDRLLQQAILTAFRQALLPGQFPAIALFLEIDPGQLDVNVHPTKTEIRFLNSRQVFHCVESLIGMMIHRSGAPAHAGRIETGSGASEFQPETEPFQTSQSPAMTWRASEPTRQESLDFTSPSTSEPIDMGPLSSGRFAGILFNTYLVYDLGDELALVDQHAADERIRFEALRNRVFQNEQTNSKEPRASQSLLIPEAVHFPVERRLELETRLRWLETLGFEVELFGESTLVFRAIPPEWTSDALRPRLKNLVDRVLSYSDRADRESPDVLMDETLFETLASEACHSAVRAGDRVEPVEAQSIVRQLFQCDHPWNCPHGRPTVVRIPRSRIEEWFQRRV